MPAFTRERTVRFSDCDPAGIVFYPQYFVMFNNLVEDCFGEVTGLGFADQHMRRRIGSPLVHTEVDFRGVSKFGDRIILSLVVKKLGRSSVTLGITCHSADDGELRLKATEIRVMTSLVDHRSIEIPDDLRAGLGSLLESIGTEESNVPEVDHSR